MFKVHVLLSGAGDPFSFTGAEAQDALRAVAPNATGFVQSRAADRQLSAEAPAYAGVAEIWFPFEADALATAPMLAGANLWREGVEAVPVLGRERTVLRTAEFAHGQGIKGVFPFSRRPDLTVAEFQRHWWYRHGPIAARTEQALGYLQCHPTQRAYDGGLAPVDGITELFWPSLVAAQAAMSSRQMTEDQSNDAGNFVDRDSVKLFLALEEVVLPP